MTKPITLLTAVLILKTSATWAQDTTDAAVLDQIVTPDIERRTITEDQLDSENWEVGIYAGIFSIEDFGSNTVTGARVAYHMSEDFTFEFNYGITEAKETSAEVIDVFTPISSNDLREYSYYNISVVYNIFQGEVFIGRNTAFNSTFYILAGGGNTTFFEQEYFTYTFGGGMRFYLTDSIALHATVKDHIMDISIIENKTTNNLEATLGLSFYF